MSQHVSGAKPPADPDRSQLATRAAASADRAQQAIETISRLDDEILLSVFGFEAQRLRHSNVYSLFGVESPDSEIGPALDRCFASLLRTAASLRKRNAEAASDRTRIALLIDDMQILHGQLDFLQKFLRAPDLLAQMARSAYVATYMQADSARRDPPRRSAANTGPDTPSGDVCAMPKLAASPLPKGILVTCSGCRRQFTAAEHLAGQQVSCSSCETVFTVPWAARREPALSITTKPASPTPLAQKIPVSCPHCHQQFRAQPELAGQQLDCPSCGLQLAVPSAAPRIDLGEQSNYGFDLADLAGAADYPGPEDYSSRRLTVRPYSSRAGGWRQADDEIPRWGWYAMGGALGACLLIFLAIALSAFLSSMRSDRAGPRESGSPGELSSDDGTPLGLSPISMTDTSQAGIEPAMPGSMPADESRWQRYSSPSGGYAILMPEGIREGGGPQPVLGVNTASAPAPDGVGRFEISFWDQPAGGDPEMALGEALRVLRRAWKATAMEERVVRGSGLAGREIRFAGREAAAAGRARIFVINRGDVDRLYVLARFGPAYSLDGPDTDRYFASFEVGDRQR